jgi:Domain of unknown function (DUF5679)
MAEYTGYCVKEKQKRLMKDVQIVTNAAGRRMAKGTCTVCGTKMALILPKA